MRLLPWAACGVLVAATGPWASAGDPEYYTKARIVLMLPSFVDWPSEPRWEQGPFDLAVLGTSPFGTYLDELAKPLTIHHRKIRIRYVSKPGQAEGCRVLFICDSERSRITSILAWAKGREILTMADDEVMARRGVMVNLLLADAKVQLASNPEAARASGISLGSQLLGMSKSILNTRTLP